MDPRKPSGCIGCPLAEIGKGFVPGCGDPRKQWRLGEAPGKDEIVVSRPFVGAAGVENEKAFRQVGSRHDDWYTANVIKCKPPKEWGSEKGRGEERNRDLWARAIRHCSQYLEAEVAASGNPGPPRLLMLGGKALWRYVGDALDTDNKGRPCPPSITNWRGSLWRQSEIAAANPGGRVQLIPGVSVPALSWPGDPWVISALHPAHIIRGQWEQRPVFAEDIRRILRKPPERGRWPMEPRMVESPRMDEVAALRGHEVVFDVETARRNPQQMFLLGLEVDDGPVYEIPWYPAWIDPVRRVLEGPALKVGHNILYDLKASAGNGVIVAPPFFDTIVAANLDEPDLPAALDECMSRYAAYYFQWKGLPDSPALQRVIGRILGLPEGFNSWWHLYNWFDIVSTKALKKILLPKLEAAGLMDELNVTMAALPRLWYAERAGMRADRAAARTVEAKLREELNGYAAEARALVAEEWAARRVEPQRAVVAGFEGEIRELEAPEPERCAKHPSYDGIRPPRAAKCSVCAGIFASVPDTARRKSGDLCAARTKQLARLRVLERGFSPTSDAHWRWWIYEIKGYKVRMRTKGGAQSVDDDVLRIMLNETGDEGVRLRLRIAKVQKHLTGYVIPITTTDRKRTILDAMGLAHPPYNCHRTSTGRLSSGGEEGEGK